MTNLIINGDAETGSLSSWLNNGFQMRTFSNSGSYSFGSTVIGTSVMSQNISTTANYNYYFSFWVYGTSTTVKAKADKALLLSVPVYNTGYSFYGAFFIANSSITTISISSGYISYVDDISVTYVPSPTRSPSVEPSASPNLPSEQPSIIPTFQPSMQPNQAAEPYTQEPDRKKIHSAGGKPFNVLYKEAKHIVTNPKNYTKNPNESNFNKKTPIGISLSNEVEIELVELKKSNVTFDYSNDGHQIKTSWVGPKDAILVYDHNSNKNVDKVSEFVLTQWCPEVKTDFEALLCNFDTNKDKIFNKQDLKFMNFYLWKDKNQDGISQDVELTSLEQAGIIAIDFNTQEEIQGELREQGALNKAEVMWSDGGITYAWDLVFYHG